jgi:ABC-type molybdate transport system substrate-binding protein
MKTINIIVTLSVLILFSGCAQMRLAKSENKFRESTNRILAAKSLDAYNAADYHKAIYPLILAGDAITLAETKDTEREIRILGEITAALRPYDKIAVAKLREHLLEVNMEEVTRQINEIKAE